MHHHNFYKSFIFTVLAGALVFYSLTIGIYPTALVNGKVVWAKEFKGMTTAAVNFYAKASETYGGKKLAGTDTRGLSAELSRATLEKLIERRLILAELSKRLPGTYSNAVQNKLALSKNANLQAAASQIYGLGLDEFVGSVLEPQAMQEVLSDFMKSRGEDFDGWLAKTKKEASVTILNSGYKWQNGAVETRD